MYAFTLESMRTYHRLTISDRENCTVFVAELPPEATEADLKALFKDVSVLCCECNLCVLILFCSAAIFGTSSSLICPRRSLRQWNFIPGYVTWFYESQLSNNMWIRS